MQKRTFVSEKITNSNTIESKLYLFSPCILKILLQDQTTGRNIFWATDSHKELGPDYEFDKPLRIELIKQHKNDIIRPRAIKNQEEQAVRTKKKAEVFTPSWLCNQMNNYIDSDWFEGPSPFNIELDRSWQTNPEPISFPKGKTWKDYVKSLRLEITCGEAPFLVSRYDTVTGYMIPVKHRIGLLDRKLRVITENVHTETAWVCWVYKAFQSVYGYEFQGDNLILARENLLLTFVEYMVDKFSHGPSTKQMQKISQIISWNIWQMDGLTKKVPFRKVKSVKELQDEARLFIEDEESRLQPAFKQNGQGRLFVTDEELQKESQEECLAETPLCRIANWEKMTEGKPEAIIFASLERD